MQVNFLMDKLYNIEKNLGGTSYTCLNLIKLKLFLEKSTGDEFLNLKDNAVTKLHEIRKKNEQKEKDKRPRNADTIKLDVEIKDLINEIDSILAKMNEALRKQSKDKKKYPEHSIKQKQKIYDNLRQQVNDLQSQGNPELTEKLDQVETVSEIKSKLMGDRKGLPKKPPKEITKEESQAIDRWKQNDVQMDAQLDLIVAGTAQWKDNATKMGEKIDHTMEQINNLNKEVDITNLELDQQNKALKDIVEKYRSPNKFCMDIVLVCVLLGLCGALYETIS